MIGLFFLISGSLFASIPTCKTSTDQFAYQFHIVRPLGQKFISPVPPVAMQAKVLVDQRIKHRLPIHVDIGGEGRYKNAINLNPQGVTTDTPRRPIPFWVKGYGQNMPFEDQTVDRITIENTPINPETILEMLRVILNFSPIA
ncbi:MAG: hypothetical protein ISR65_10865 [Bacteriovoracaceae bacterium]|nr:hypothetical protein [Bacteriovoracaceae bacterium]